MCAKYEECWYEKWVLVLEQKEDIIILGVETSCDETSAAVVKNGRQILSNVISSQIDLHKKYGGVVPEIASRKHVELIIPVIDKALEDAGVTTDDIAVIGVTCGPGLVGALLVGISAAKALSFVKNIPLVGVNHIEGHIAANYLEFHDLTPPFVCLIVSGGHSHIVYAGDYDSFETLGRTRDDAAGEAFDKIARALGLGYPGGPVIDRLSKCGNEQAVDFPRVHLGRESLDFSFSGLKTAVLNYINSAQQKNMPVSVEDVCASFQKAVVDVLVENTMSAVKRTGVEKIVLAGGVAANSCLRHNMRVFADRFGYKLYYPPVKLCTDNAAMIASAAYFQYVKGKVSKLDLNANAGLKLGER